jgi:hypothetical protein
MVSTSWVHYCSNANVTSEIFALNSTDGSYARTLLRTKSTPLIEVCDHGQLVLARIECHGFGSVFDIKWVDSGKTLLCLFNDGTILEYCSMLRTTKRAYRIPVRSVTTSITTGACVITNSGVVLVADAHILFFMRHVGKVLSQCISTPKPLNCLAVSKAHTGSCYLATPESVLLFSRLRKACRLLLNTLAIEACPSGNLVIVITANHVLSVFSSDLENCIFSSSVSISGFRCMLWNTPKVLRIICDRAVYLLTVIGEYTLLDLNCTLESPSSLLYALLDWKYGAIEAFSGLKKESTTSVSTKATGVATASHFLTRACEHVSTREHEFVLADVAHRRSVLQWAQHAEAPGCLRQYLFRFAAHLLPQKHMRREDLANYKVALSTFLVRNGRPYAALKVSPDAFRRVIMLDWLEGVLCRRSAHIPTNSFKLLIEHIKKVPGVDVSQLCDGVPDKELCDCLTWCEIINLEPRMQKKVDFALKTHSLEMLATALPSMLDTDQLHKVARASFAPGGFLFTKTYAFTPVLARYVSHIWSSNSTTQEKKQDRDILEEVVKFTLDSRKIQPKFLNGRNAILRLLSLKLHQARPEETGIEGRDFVLRGTRDHVRKWMSHRPVRISTHEFRLVRAFDWNDFAVHVVQIEKLAQERVYDELFDYVVRFETVKEVSYLYEVLDAFNVSANTVLEIQSSLRARFRKDSKFSLIM